MTSALPFTSASATLRRADFQHSSDRLPRYAQPGRRLLVTQALEIDQPQGFHFVDGQPNVLELAGADARRLEHRRSAAEPATNLSSGGRPTLRPPAPGAARRISAARGVQLRGGIFAEPTASSASPSCDDAPPGEDRPANTPKPARRRSRVPGVGQGEGRRGATWVSSRRLPCASRRPHKRVAAATKPRCARAR